MTTTLATLLLCTSLLGATPELPQDDRLQPVRTQLQAAVADADRAGQPTELLVNKVREGLAKRVPPERIALVVRQWAAFMREADRTLKSQGHEKASAALVRTFVEGRLAGVPADQLGALAKRGVAEAQALETMAAVTDLSMRGYAPADAVAVVTQLRGKDADNLPRLGRELETLRRQFALGHGDVIESVQQGLSLSGSLDGALKHVRANGPSAGPGKGHGHGHGEDHPGQGVGLSPGRGKARGRNR